MLSWTRNILLQNKSQIGIQPIFNCLISYSPSTFLSTNDLKVKEDFTILAIRCFTIIIIIP